MEPTIEKIVPDTRVIVMVRGTELGRGRVMKIEDPPRLMTGGRGFTIRLDGGRVVDGYDEDDLVVIHPVSHTVTATITTPSTTVEPVIVTVTETGDDPRRARNLAGNVAQLRAIREAAPLAQIYGEARITWDDPTMAGGTLRHEFHKPIEAT